MKQKKKKDKFLKLAHGLNGKFVTLQKNKTKQNKKHKHKQKQTQNLPPTHNK